MTLGFKFQLLPRTEGLYIYSTCVLQIVRCTDGDNYALMLQNYWLPPPPPPPLPLSRFPFICFVIEPLVSDSWIKNLRRFINPVFFLLLLSWGYFYKTYLPSPHLVVLQWNLCSQRVFVLFLCLLDRASLWKLKNNNQLDSTYFILLLICSTCFGHYYAHHRELTTIVLNTTLVVSFLVCCRLEVRCG